jgi:hypothetical protein
MMILPAVTRGELPKYKSIFLNIENDEISMFASSKDEPVNVTFDTKKIRNITIQPTSARRIFRNVETEEILIEFSETPRIPVQKFITAEEAAETGIYPTLVIGKKACGKEFIIYKKLLSKFAERNNISFSDLTQTQEIEEMTAS